MPEEKYKNIIAEYERLPQGGITYKKINGKEYAYYQWREDGKQRSRRAKDDELETLIAQIERRKELETILKDAGLLTKTKKTKPRKAAQKKSPAMTEEKTTKTTKKTTVPKAVTIADRRIESRWLEDETRKAVRTALYQQDEGEEQVDELIQFLLEDAFFDGLLPAIKETTATVLAERLRARLLEDRLHLATKAAKPHCQVFHLFFDKGTFEMVVADEKTESCQLYEIKHCHDLSHAHAEYLLNDDICESIASRYGHIDGKFVLYYGKTINVMEAGSKGVMESVKYMNVEKYLEGLKR